MFIKMGCFGSDYYIHKSLKYSSLFDPCSDVLGTGSPECKGSVCYLLTNWPRDIHFSQPSVFYTISINTGDCYKMGSVLEICRANMVLFFMFSLCFMLVIVCLHMFQMWEGYPNKIISILLFKFFIFKILN